MHINCLKTNSLILLVLVSIQIGYTQNSLTISGIYENGNHVNRSDTFLLNDNCQFFILDEDGNKEELSSCVWRFECLDNDSKYIIDREINNTNDFDFLLDDLNVNPALIKRITSSNGINVLFQARISCIGQTNLGKNFDLSFPLYLNLIPSTPDIQILLLKIYENSVAVRLNIFSNRADEYVYYLTEYYNSGSLHELYTYNFDFSMRIDCDYVEVMAFGLNKFGWSAMKLFKFNYANLEVGINEINVENELSFYPNPFNDVLNIKGEYGNIDKLVVADLSGRTVKIINKVDLPTIQVADLPQGMYLITVIEKYNSKNKSFKLFKK